MTKIFLSHSSKDKISFVNHVYKNLCRLFGEARVIIDQFSFEEGRRTTEEIASFIEQSDLIVLLISESSLSSEWVQEEYELAYSLYKSKNCQICPIIIDKDIKHSDSRIPIWLQNEFNIQCIISTRKTSDIIAGRMYEILYSRNPKESVIRKIFVGRNELLNKVEERLDSFTESQPKVLIASGLEGVGRKTFLTKGVIKSNLVRESFPFPEISVNYTESIEDFILKLSDLGFTDGLSIADIASCELSVKIDVLIALLAKLQTSKEIIIVRDYGCIINYEGEMADWFYNVISSTSLKNEVVLLVVAKFKHVKNKKFDSHSFDLAIPELSVKERAGLLSRLLIAEEIDIPTDEKESITSILTGYPNQVHFAVRMLKELGLDQFNKERYRVVDFGNKNSSVLLSEIQENEDKMALLVLLSKFDYIDKSFVKEVFNDKDQLFFDALQYFYLQGIVDYLGTSSEYIRLSDIVKDYIKRGRFELSEEYSKRLHELSKEILANQELQDDISVPELLFTTKQALIDGEDIDDNAIIPSIYLSTMNDLYHSKKYSYVIKFADKALEHEKNMEKNIIFEIRYLLCSALAQLKQERFKTEVQQIYGADHHFLFGFYYRKLGKFDLALEKYNLSIQERPNFSKAKREKVQVLIGMQDYHSALDLAKSNYENYKANPYHIQAYFSCIIKCENPYKNIELLQQLINEISLIHNTVAYEMTLRMRAQYEALINHSKEKSYELIDEAIAYDENLPYARMIKFDIAERFKDLNEMKQILSYFEESENHNKHYSSNIIYMKSIVLLYEEKDLDKAKSFFTEHVFNYTDEAKNQVFAKMEHIFSFIVSN